MAERKRFDPRICLLFLLLAPFLFALWHKHSIAGDEGLPEPLDLRLDSHLSPHDTTLSAYWNAGDLLRRDGDYHCTNSTPCSTYACCGSFFNGVGTCGFGPTFCGSDCTSDCDAKPECGQYADPPGKTCPLNVCCSKYGFCGSTELFCEDGCQSNCVLDPPVPAGGSGIPVIQNKVIGYYEAWAARRTCRAFPPSGIPVEGLTHVNFAFAYVDPQSLQIMTMDSETPEGLFAQTTNLKNMNSGASDLQVFISVGGWTFSDNDTTTQSVFPSIAADPAKQQQLADNLVSFMTEYGFDGVDIDWEYPGAPDRGGQPENTKGYVQLVQTLRKTFKASARGNYGLSFTIPTSYWYLRWFDVPGMLKYADWANLMAYDLHGVWDAHDPIGSIVQAHTNLTEIKLAVDLLWRNDVPPGQVVLGMGFYGRSFQLQNPSCNTPGCPFSGPAEPGPCTDNAGTLAYFEIMDILNASHPNVVHDSEAAVNYIVFGDNNNQWVSYDDAVTFQQKVDWANSVGLGGVMIWSVDQDDISFSALEGLIGESLPSFNEQEERSQNTDTNHWASLNGQECQVSDCLPDHTSPPSGFSIAPNGQFPDRCGGGKYKYIYCPTNALPQSCQWRGSGSCHGQCHPGEVTLAHSPHGSRSCLRPGQQAFCCVSNEWAPLVDNCGWSNGCDSCPADSSYAVSTRTIEKGFFGTCTQSFCCPYDFQNCHWIGKGTCDDNECSSTDVQVGLDPVGNTGTECAIGLNGRQKALCCNTPENLNPFLPVPLENLFPVLPPSGDIPAFDNQILSQLPVLVGSNPSNGAFLFVVIDGPPDAVTNLNKRDGSHIEFLTGPVHHGQASQTAHIICMDDSPSSNCDDMYLKGLSGTIIRLPDHLGFAQWAVAHDVRSSNYSAPRHLLKRIPQGSRVMELEYSYDFSKVKRAPGPIYMRVDYASNNDYWTDVVAAAHQKKRDLQPRFWSTILTIWQNIIQNIRTAPYDPQFQPSISNDNFNVLIYGEDGSRSACNGADGFLKLNLAGTMRSVMRFGVTLVGTIQPFEMEEAYGFFDTDMYMSGQFDFDGKGILDINGGDGVQRSLFSSPFSNFQASHPGIVSFSPELNAVVSLIGKGEIDGQFSVNFETGSSKTFTTNAPPNLGQFGGDILTNTFNDAATGYLDVADPSFNTIFGLNYDLQSSMNVQVYQYGESQQQAGATFSANTPHAIRVLGNDGTGKPSIQDAPQQGSSEVIQDGDIQSGWDDGTTHPIGHQPNPVNIFTGGEAPPSPRQVPNINGYAVFGDHDFITCSAGSFSGKLTCFYNITANDSSLIEPDPPYKLRLMLKREDLEPLTPEEEVSYSTLVERAGGPSAGSSETYTVRNFNNPIQDTAAFVTPTYPNGDGGDALDEESGRVTRYALADPNDCEDATITVNGVQGVNYAQVDAEHPRDRSITPNSMISDFFQTGRMDLEDGQGTVFQSTYAPIDWDDIYNYMFHDYRIWVPGNVEENPPPGSLFFDLADALGSTTNPDVMSNLEHNLNVLKGRLYTRQGLPASNEAFANQMDNPGQGTAEAAFSNLNAVFGVFNYMNAINSDRQQVFGAQVASAETWDTLFAGTTGRQGNAANLVREFWTQWDIRLVNFTRRYITMRLDQMENVYRPLANGPNSLGQEVLNIIGNMRGRITTEITLPTPTVPT